MRSIPAKTIIRELPADLDTPISVYLKTRNAKPSFLLESVEGGETVARYSFIGIDPLAQFILYTDHVIEIKDGMEIFHPLAHGDDPIRFLERELGKYTVEQVDGLPRFNGGLVGFMGYEMVQFFEPTLQGKLPMPKGALGHYLLTDTVIAFDHARRSVKIITHVFDGDIRSAEKRVEDVYVAIQAPLPSQEREPITATPVVSNKTREEHEKNVLDAKDHIKAGDIFQVVLSQRFSKTSNADPFDVYRSVRRLNPSPYMYFFDLGIVNGEPFALVGASPEMLVRAENGIATLRPIAGTRKRGATPEEDATLYNELNADEKENAEHIMLVDLGRNDLGRVCEYGSVKVTGLAFIEKYSHVMHIVSNVTGVLQKGKNAFDLVRAAFPAGTVSGAPKVRAMQIIAELEGSPRGVYAGMVGYFGFDGAMDGCIAIRTLVVEGNTFSVQAGGGIVADSEPYAEYMETINKSMAMLKAIEMTENEQ